MIKTKLHPGQTYHGPDIIHIHTYKCVYFSPRHCFLFQPRVFPRAPGSVAHRELARTPFASLGPGRGPWHLLWGLKWHVRSGRHSEHVEPSRPMQTHTYIIHYEQVEKKSDGSHVISGILNVVNAVRHYLVMESFKECPGLVRVLILSSICHHTAVYFEV